MGIGAQAVICTMLQEAAENRRGHCEMPVFSSFLWLTAGLLTDELFQCRKATEGSSLLDICVQNYVAAKKIHL